MSNTFLIRCTLLLYLVVIVNSDNCEIKFRETGHEVAETKYLIDLSVKGTQHGMATTYFPDTQYDIIIRPISEALTFKEFHFKMENINRTMSYGALELRDPYLSTFDTNNYCINRVINLATPNKPNITIGWQSPPTKSGCIELTAYVKETELRYHTANLTVCEDERIELDDPGKVMTFCCACQKAKYEMTFEGKWSKYTHPRNFPKKDWLAGFPTVIGAAHDPHYQMWDVYTNASDAMKKFVETGHSVDLELDLKAHRENITTFIKFRGTNFKNKTLARAQLRVERDMHVVSLVARINPSPDWFIGVSKLELCQKNCTWMESKTLNLYAYDVGSRTGLAYEQENNDITYDVINHLNMSWPVPDINGTIPPFYDKTNNTHEVRPLAQIHFKLIRVYGPLCNIDESLVDESCVGNWNVTQPCVVTCGKGVIIYEREYLDGYNKSNCAAAITKKEKCEMENECPEIINDEICPMTQWSSWTKCEKSCGVQTTMRHRNYKFSNTEEKCKNHFRDSDHALAEYKDCGLPLCPSATPNCATLLYTQWSDWGPCSVTVGKGLSYRQRDRVNKVLNKEQEYTIDEDTGFAGCLYEKKVCDGIDPATVTQKPIVEEEYLEEEHSLIPKQTENLKPPECALPVDPGIPCPRKSSSSEAIPDQVDSYHRYAYHQENKACVPFSFTGCGGNANNFISVRECHDKCISEEMIDCRMGPWTPWSLCNECKIEQSRSRIIEVEPYGGGRPCPVAGTFEKRDCPKRDGCDIINMYRNPK